VKLRDPRLVKLLLVIAADEKRFLPDYVEYLLTQQLKKNPAYKDYFKSDAFEIELKQNTCKRIYRKPTLSLQSDRFGISTEN